MAFLDRLLLRRRRDQTTGEDTAGEVAELSPEEAEAEERRRTGLAAPEDYLAELCALHQVVMLGDRRYVAQHLEFLAEMVPRLWAAGVRNLGWEFTNTRLQGDLDRLVTADAWDASAAHDLFVDVLGVGLAYQEYVDVLRAAWDHNRRLDDDAPTFRVVALGLPSYVDDPDLLDGRSAAEVELRNWWLGGHYRDVTAIHMANAITNEVVRRGERCLVYADTERTTTRLLSIEGGQPAISAGNLLYRWMGEGVQRVLFHGALDDDAALERVELLIANAPDDVDRFGIDLEYSTLGNVWVPSVKGLLGGSVEPLQLGDVADGYLYLGDRASWRPVRLAEGFLHPGNLDRAERQYRALDPRDEPYDLDELQQVIVEGWEAIPDTWPSPPGTGGEPADDDVGPEDDHEE
jgi:hypothetical protein